MIKASSLSLIAPAALPLAVVVAKPVRKGGGRQIYRDPKRPARQDG